MQQITYYPRTIVSSKRLNFQTTTGELELLAETPVEITPEQLSSLKENPEFEECVKQSILIIKEVTPPPEPQLEPPQPPASTEVKTPKK